MIQISDHPVIRLMERYGEPDDPRCCANCRWYYEDERLCCGSVREPIVSPEYEICEGWQSWDD